MKKNIFIILVIATLLFPLISFFCRYITFDYVTKPFSGYDKSYLEGNYKYDICYKEEFVYYYTELVDYKKYEEKYDTDFYYFIGKKTYIYWLSTFWENYAYEGYSYIIRPENEYEELKELIITSYQFDSIKTGEYAEYSTDSLSYKGWIYMHILYEFTEYYYDHYTNILPASFWLSYNDDTKEITFSFIYFGQEKDFFRNENSLIDYLYTNLYH